ncbi:MAG: Gfo/Idh/MocA family oxidoreductase [Clostridia bacterium]|nr:Gfo/Idh/MocA family oxidoreductase [Clostridia bacterium]
MKKVRAIMIGTGNRGTNYAERAKENSPEFELVAIADPNPTRRDYVQKLYNLPGSACYDDYREILSEPKMADMAIIATQDKMHFEPAMMAIEKGYHLLLEKPVAPTPEECVQIAEAANKKGVDVVVCHVLRFSPFFMTIKNLIDEGRIGDVMHVVHTERVGNAHMSHSFVRGNWRNSQTSAPMILAKSCHDMDILNWLIGKRCTRVQSFGSLTYFTRANMPEGAPEYCVQGCPAAENCPYDARRIYLKDRMFIQQATNSKNPTDEDILRAITETNYGKCVFQSDNDVVDHQVVNLEYEGGATVSFSMCAFNTGGRRIRIMGTKGEIIGNMSDEYVTLFDFMTRETERVMISDAVQDETINGGHGGGDSGIVRSFVQLVAGEYEGKSITDIDTSIESHLIAFAAEEARLTGKTIDIREYKKQFLKEIQ